MHSPETGGPEMLMELAYRLVVEETPMIQNIRNNVISFITPVVEPDGRDKIVDAYYFNKKYGATVGRMSSPYWGRYVAHDNNRDGMGQFLDLTKNITRTFLEWTPQILHDLHESVTYLYASTGTGPYNEQLDPITIDEWWTLADQRSDRDGEARTCRACGPTTTTTAGFRTTCSSSPTRTTPPGDSTRCRATDPTPRLVRPGATTTSREWYRPNPPLAAIKWGPRANTNIQESAHPAHARPGWPGAEDLPRELLDQEQALRREGPQRPGVSAG